jgi:hypothetical protein
MQRSHTHTRRSHTHTPATTVKLIAPSHLPDPADTQSLGLGDELLMAGPDDPTSLVVLLAPHRPRGAGSWVPMVEMLTRQFPQTRFLMPTAAPRKHDHNPTPRWYKPDYDAARVLTQHRGDAQNAAGTMSRETGRGMAFGPWFREATPSIEAVTALLDQQFRDNEHLSPRVSALVGFLQGGGVGLWAAMRRPACEPLAGVLCLSAFLPVPSGKYSIPTIAGQTTPVRIIAGTSDLVHPRFAAATQQHLSKEGVTADLKVHAKTERTLNSEQRLDICKFLETIPK